MKQYFNIVTIILVVFSAICIILAIPPIVKQKEYYKILILVFIFAFIFGLLFYLYKILISPVENIELKKEYVVLKSGGDDFLLEKKMIIQVTMTPCRYILSTGNETYYISRVGFFRIKESIDVMIKDLAKEVGLEIKSRWFPF